MSRALRDAEARSTNTPQSEYDGNDAFAHQVRDALTHLSDPIYLQTHPLARSLVRRQRGSLDPAKAGRALAQRLHEAITALQPSGEVRNRRACEILQLRYVEALDPPVVQRRLALGKSQYYLEHARALEAIVSLLRPEWLPAAAPHEEPHSDQPQLVGDGTSAPMETPVAANESPSRAVSAVHAHLPAPLSSFIGRRRELAAIKRLLLGAKDDEIGPPARVQRLLTLTGPAGTGKTRLALEVARAVRDERAKPVCFVALAPLSDPDLVLPAIAHALRIPEGGALSLFDQVCETLGAGESLLVLDNFEHLLAAAPLLARLLDACAALQVLVTSRTGLGLYGEQEYPVSPLSLPALGDRGPATGRQAPPQARDREEATGDRRQGTGNREQGIGDRGMGAGTQSSVRPPSSGGLAAGGAWRPARPEESAFGSSEFSPESCGEAVQLFVERARAFQPDFALSAENLSVVVEICRRLDGLPLAIELAAVRLRVLSPEALRTRLQVRLDLLTGGARHLPERQRTLRGALDWSYSPLSESERTLFRRLAIFRGGCTLEAAEFVASPHVADVIEAVTSLLEKHLLVREEDRDGEARFSMLETVREYALGRLQEFGETLTSSRRHAEYFLAFAEEAETHLTDADQGIWLERLDRDFENLRGALAWFHDQGAADEELRLAGALWRFWYVRGYLTEGRMWLGASLSGGSPAPLRSRAKALLGAAGLAWAHNDYPAAAALAGESLDLARELEDRRGVALALNVLGQIAGHQGANDRAAALWTESLALFRSAGDRWGIGLLLSNLAVARIEQGALDEALTLASESLELRQQLGDRQGSGFLLHNMGRIAQRQGDAARALLLCEASLEIFRGLGDRRGMAMVLNSIGAVAQSLGDHERVAEALRAGLSLRRDVGNKLGIADSLNAVGVWLSDRRRWREAVRLLSAAEALCAGLNAALHAAEQQQHAEAVAEARAHLDPPRFAAAWAEGGGLSLDQAIADALDQTLCTDPADTGEDPSAGDAPPAETVDDRPILSPREGEVLRLIAAGKSNREIAAALVLSVHTVERHVANIYAKTGITGKASMVGYAVRHGLLPSA
jgi:predicted ATPase/DNA-binding CsgD family transcriptional regulator